MWRVRVGHGRPRQRTHSADSVKIGRGAFDARASRLLPEEEEGEQTVTSLHVHGQNGGGLKIH